MEDRYERFSIADPLYYDEPSRADRPGDWFPAATDALPAGWVRSYRSPWLVLLPPQGMTADQGWKLHVSTTLDGAERVVGTVVRYCQKAGLPVKFLRSRQAVALMNSKYANRRSSGKTLTVYPPDAAALKTALDELSVLLDGAEGAYILSDLRWRQGPLHVRYGSFVQRWCTDENGRRVLALRGPDGTLVPDVRETFFTPPAGAPLPDFLADQIARNAEADSASDPAAQFPFEVEKALHFSNGGGIYLATDLRDGRRVVLREARPHAGLDAEGADAVTRLHRERTVLEQLEDLDFAPRLYEHLQVWEHHFLVEEYIEGEQLEQEFTRRCPLTKPDPDPRSVAEYTEWALDVIAQLEAILGRLHERGLVFGDLHPGNVLIRPEGRVALVDFELAFRAEDGRGPALGAPGFISPAARCGTAVDEFALAALRLYLFLPQNLLLGLDSTVADRVAEMLPRLYPVPADFGRMTASALHRAAGGRLPRGNIQAAGGPEAPPWPTAGAADGAAWQPILDSLAAGILTAATPERTDRLFPGDIAQFEEPHPSVGLAHGAAGVLYTLHACGYDVPDEHLDWLLTAARTPGVPPGLYDGLSGAAWALLRLGRTDAAAELLARAQAGPTPQLTGLAGGRAGLAIALLDFADATGDRAHASRALDLGRRLAAGEDAPAAAPAVRGLLEGRTGLAALYLRLFARTGDGSWKTAAGRELAAELDEADWTEGRLLLKEDAHNRLLPYLGAGGLGLAQVIAAHPDHDTTPALSEALAAALRSCMPRQVIAAGLFEGRASMVLHLARQVGRHRDATSGTSCDDGCRDLLDRHLRDLSWQVMGLRGHYAIPGRRLLRLSTDLATGSAGLLLALHEAVRGPVPLPGITDFPGQPVRGEHTHGRNHS